MRYFKDREKNKKLAEAKKEVIAHNKLATKRRQAAFLEAYRLCGAIYHAAKRIGISPSNHYAWLRSDDNYRQQFEGAIEEAIESLESEALRRARDGVPRPVYQGGKQVGEIRDYSDVLLIFLLKGLRPEKYRERQEIQQTVTHGGPVEIRVVRDENWYGNANRLPAEALAAPDSPPAISGEI